MFFIGSHILYLKTEMLVAEHVSGSVNEVSLPDSFHIGELGTEMLV